VRDKPFRILENGKEVPLTAKLCTGEQVEILEREMIDCPACIGGGTIYSDYCRECRERGKVAMFLVKLTVCRE